MVVDLPSVRASLRSVVKDPNNVKLVADKVDKLAVELLDDIVWHWNPGCKHRIYIYDKFGVGVWREQLERAVGGGERSYDLQQSVWAGRKGVRGGRR